jgi:predicted nuclease of predicted toxin-antitoxin system
MRLLFDAHVPLAVARRLHDEGYDVVGLSEWLGGNYRTAADEHILAAAAADTRVLVTFDVRTIPQLLKEWAETGQSHSGVILVDRKTLYPSDVGGIVRSLRAFAAESFAEQWQDRVEFLRRPVDRHSNS